MNAVKKIALGIGVLSLLSCLGILAYIAQPPNLGRLSETAQVIRSEDGNIINLKLTSDGYWRERVEISEIDPDLIAMLIAYEDKRYWDHKGVDPLAVMRASLDFLKSGRITSGASTLTMQTVRLLNPALAKRTIPTKLRQMVEALRLEAHWSKEEILEAYFSIAPYGGNIEGVIAASEAWLQKPPKELTMSEIALLVALPQSPETRRPDLHPKRAQRAKNYVLRRVATSLKLDSTTLLSAQSAPLPVRFMKPASIAPHLSDKFSATQTLALSSTINADWQKDVFEIVSNSLSQMPAPINGAALVVERGTGDVKAYVGSADYLNKERKGGVNYLTAIRSPGSTLKPLIYGKALQRNLINQDTVFADTEFVRGNYTPTNFDGGFNGKVSVKNALLRSLNIPAIKTLEVLGSDAVENELNTFLSYNALQDQNAGLSLAVGGYYLNAEQLAEVYLSLIDPGTSTKLNFGQKSSKSSEAFITQPISDVLVNLLIQDLPSGATVAFKTGTSAYRENAWSVQIFHNHLVIAWFGTPDNEPTDILTGLKTAFPISNEIGRRLGLKAPERQATSQPTQQAHTTQQTVCDRLIEFPTDGSWIRSKDPIIRVAGNQSASWFLNGKKIELIQNQVPVTGGGVHRITAKSQNCSETHEIFVELTSK